MLTLVTLLTPPAFSYQPIDPSASDLSSKRNSADLSQRRQPPMQSGLESTYLF